MATSTQQSGYSRVKASLKRVKFQPNKMKFTYVDKYEDEQEEELKMKNETAKIVAFKIKRTSLLKIVPSYGYLKPEGVVTIWVTVKPNEDGTPPKKETFSVLLAFPSKVFPDNPMQFWVGEPNVTRVKRFKIKFAKVKQSKKSKKTKTTTSSKTDT